MFKCHTVETTYTLTDRFSIEISNGLSKLWNSEQPSENEPDLLVLTGKRYKDTCKRKKQIANQYKNIIPFKEKEKEQDGEGRKRGRGFGGRKRKEGEKESCMFLDVHRYHVSVSPKL